MVKYLSIFVAGCVSGFILSSLYSADTRQESRQTDTVSEAGSESETQDRAGNAVSTGPAGDNKNTDVSADESDTAVQHAGMLRQMQEEIARLQAQNSALTQSRKYPALPQNEQNEQTGDPQDISLMSDKEASEHLSQQLQQHIPPSHLRLTSDMAPVTQMQIIKMHQQEEDYGWGYDIQTKIQDLFITQFDPAQQQLQAVTCRQGQCELLISLYNDAPGKDIFDVLRSQPWWQFGSTNSRSANGQEEGELVMYLFASNWQEQ